MLHKFIILLLTVLVSISANAQFKTETEMKTFFEKNKKCSLAVGIVNPSITGKSKGERTLLNLVMCVADFSAQEGTINEQKGCGFAIYDVLKNKISTPYATALDGHVTENPKKTKGLNIPLVLGKKCADGGFEVLMNLYAGAPLGGDSVGKTLTDGPKQDKAEKLFLYSDTQKYKIYWRDRSIQRN